MHGTMNIKFSRPVGMIIRIELRKNTGKAMLRITWETAFTRQRDLILISFRSRRRRQHVRPKRWYLLTRFYRVITQIRNTLLACNGKNHP